MKWFSHDSNAAFDSKMKKLLITHGAEGYAVYFHCLELIANDINENHIDFRLEHDSEIIADNLKIKGTTNESARDRVEGIMHRLVELNLVQEINGHIFCFQMARRISGVQIKNKKLASLKKLIEKAFNSSKNFLDASKNSQEFSREFLLQYNTNNTNNTNNTIPNSARPKKPSQKKSKSGVENNVLLTEGELAKLTERFGEHTSRVIDYFSLSLATHGYKYKSHYLAIIKWDTKDSLVSQLSNKDIGKTSSQAVRDKPYINPQVEINRQRQEEVKRLWEQEEKNAKS